MKETKKNDRTTYPTHRATHTRKEEIRVPTCSPRLPTQVEPSPADADDTDDTGHDSRGREREQHGNTKMPRRVGRG